MTSILGEEFAFNLQNKIKYEESSSDSEVGSQENKETKESKKGKKKKEKEQQNLTAEQFARMAKRRVSKLEKHV